MKNQLQPLLKYAFNLCLIISLNGIIYSAAYGQCGMTVNTSITNVTCYNGTNGAVTVTASGGVAPYLYQLAEAGAGAWSSINTFSGLAGSTYPLSVKDNAGCIKTIYVSITQPAAFAVSYTASDVTCSGGSNGSISINTVGGTAAYSYAWTKNGSAYSTAANLTNLLPGNYGLIVTDANGCTTTPIVSQQIKSIGLTGFNEDVVANGTGVSPASSTSQAYDDGNGNVLYADGYTNASSVAETPGGLPIGGNFASTQSATRFYQLASYSASNALLLRSSTATTYGGALSGTLSFQNQYQGTYNTLYVLASTGSGTGTVNYTINFADATTATGSLTFADWYLVGANSQSAIKLKRIARTTGVYDTRYDFNLFELPITIAGSNQGKVINSIGFAWTNAGSARVNIMAVTGYTSTTAGIRINDGTTSTVVPSVSILSNAASNIFCTGQTVIFTASPVNGGASPSYQWKKNGTNIGSNSPTCTYSSLNNNDVITVVLTSNLPCVSSATATSNAITMVNGTATASVSMTASASSVCGGNTVSFTAAPVNGGSTPAYQWKLNNVNIGTNSPTFTSSSLSNNDQVKVLMTSSIGCATPNPSTSNTINIIVSPVLTPDITIVSVPLHPAGNGNPAIFTAIATNGGLTPAYQWLKNGAPIAGATLPILNAANVFLTETYSCRLTSSYACATVANAMSNYIVVNGPGLPVTLEWYNARPENGKALLQWKTAQESNNKQFIIERALSTSSTNYTQVGTVAATSASNGATYNFINDPGLKGIFLYRLTQEDIDGNKKMLGIRSVNLNGKNSWMVQDLGSYWQLSCTEAFTYRLVDMQGRLLKLYSGKGTVSIDKPNAAGIYLLQLETGGELFTQKLLK
ncbi:MAG: T9SS type A sorting domain-containing protein [Ferruginibacter sp.]